MKKEKEQFKGFDLEPSTWNFPMNINGWVHKLTGAEFKVLWYILRHTWGWQKDSDTISQKQFKYGIKKKDGKWLDRGTGLGEGTIKIAIRGLIKKGFFVKDEKIIYVRVRDELKKHKHWADDEELAMIISRKLLVDLGYKKLKKFKIDKDEKELVIARLKQQPANFKISIG